MNDRLLRAPRPVIFLLLCLAGCGAGDPVPLDVTTAVFPNIPEPPARWSDHYGGESDAVTPTDEEQLLWRAIGRPCIPDGRLIRGARRHARDLVESPGTAAGQLDRLRFTLHQLGAYDYTIEPFTQKLAGVGGALVAAIEKTPSAWTHCGLGIAANGTERFAVWIGVRRAVHLDPVPITPPSLTRMAIRGSFRDVVDGAVKLFIGLPDGAVRELAPREEVGSGRFVFDVSITRQGRYELELLADTGHGLEIVALLPVFAGVSPDERPILVPERQDPVDVPFEESLGRFLNESRRKLGLPALQRDPRLDAVARDHSEDMATSGFFGHVSPTRGGLGRRLESQRLSPRQFAENIAKSSTLSRIHRNLMKSPSHRLGMLSDEYTHVGIGVVRQSGELIATEVYAAW